MKDEFLSKAKENLKAAQILFDNGLFNASANRAYYAAFQMAISALAHRGINVKKNKHKQVQSIFNREFIKKRKTYPSSIKSHLLEMLNVRIEADYYESGIAKKAAHRQLLKAKEFVETTEKALK